MNNQLIFRVSGKSMEADNIYDGDFVIVKKDVVVVNHDIVVISLPDKSRLVKHIYRRGKHLFFYPFSISTSSLLSINKKPPPQKTYRPMDDAVVIGKVVAIVSNHKKGKKIL